jgi:excisionase family DNA binding protein
MNSGKKDVLAGLLNVVRQMQELDRHIETLIAAYMETCEEEERERPAPVKEEAGTGYLTVEEAAAYTTLSVSTIRHALMKRSIPHCKNGRRVLFSRAQLDQFLQAKSQAKSKPTEEALNERADALLNRKRRSRRARA